MHGCGSFCLEWKLQYCTSGRRDRVCIYRIYKSHHANMIQIPSFGALGLLNFTCGVRLLVHGAIFSDDIVLAHFVIVSPRPATWEYEHAILEMLRHACM